MSILTFFELLLGFVKFVLELIDFLHDRKDKRAEHQPELIQCNIELKVEVYVQHNTSQKSDSSAKKQKNR